MDADLDTLATALYARIDDLLSCRQPSRLRRRGQAEFAHPGLPAPAAAVFPVSVWPAVQSAGRRWCPPVRCCRGAVPVRGGSVIFDPLAGRSVWLCRLGQCPGGAS